MDEPASDMQPAHSASPTALVRARGALVFALGGPAPGDDVALAWAGLALPLIGFGVGLVLRALVTSLQGSVPELAVASAAALALWLAGGLGFVRAATEGRGALVTAIAALALVVLEVALFSALGRRGTCAIPLAALLGRWGLVILAYGSQPAPGDGLAGRIVKQLGFNQFAVASVSTMALTLLLVDAVGLVLLFAVAAQTIGLRIAVHARRGGITGSSLGTAAVLGELTTLIASTALASLHAAIFPD
jgi:cobalamin synthase